MSNVRIQGIEIYYPQNKVDNQYYINYFSEKGKKIDRLLEAYGRKERYIVDDENENMITMAVKAGQKALESCNLTGDDIDLLVVSTQTPEYIWPTNSLIIFGKLNINPRAQVFDQNANCLGMLTAVANANAAMRGTPEFKRALIIGSDNFSMINNPESEYLYPIMGDSACAVILEKTDNENEGILATEFLSDGSAALTAARCPKNGFKKLFSDKDEKICNWWDPFDAGFVPEQVCKLNAELTKRTGIFVKDIDHFCYSQYAKSMSVGIAQSLDVDFDKFIYVGDKYGYTGTTSPFIAMYEGIKSGKIKRGDLISMWSVGIFWTTCGIYMRY